MIRKFSSGAGAGAGRCWDFDQFLRSFASSRDLCLHRFRQVPGLWCMEVCSSLSRLAEFVDVLDLRTATDYGYMSKCDLRRIQTRL